MLNAPVYQDSSGQEYKDHKRYLWLASILVPFITMLGPALYLLSDQLWTLWAPMIIFYGLFPFVDYALGKDRSNPPESVVSQLEEDKYYARVTFLVTPLLWVFFIVCAWFVATYELPWYGFLAVAMTAGLVCGFGLNMGHEMGHKKDPLNMWLAKIVLSLGAYGHFFIEHNYGHHRDVATPEDPASSRMGENIYKFLLREMPGGFIRAWNIEKQRLARDGKSPWSLHNEVLQPLLITVVLWSSLIAVFGWIMIPFLAITFFWGAFQLTSANYIEHYGLLRKKNENGRYERCQPHHSWNSNHIFSNWITFHLQRHSDHHAYPARHYQSLRHFEDVPQLPNGYFGMFVLAYFPPIWYAVMDKRLLNLVGKNVSDINIDPDRKDYLVKRYGLIDNV